MHTDGVRIRTVGAFLALAFGLSWTTALVLAVLDVPLVGLRGTLLVVAGYMWAPAVAAVVVTRWQGESVRERCGLARGRLRWTAVAWVAPVALLGATVGIGALLPEVSFSTDYAAALLRLGLPPEAIDAAMATLEGLPVPPVVLFVGQGLLAGVTVNTVAALGEELGWRGLLLSELSPLGFWRLSLFTGLVWGLWHTPLVLQGHNFPDAPVAGVAVMTAWTVVVSPTFTYLALRAESVLAPAVFHGTFNAVGGLSLVYLAGAGTLLTSPVGVAGVGAAAVATACCVAHDRYLAAASVTTGAVSP